MAMRATRKTAEKKDSGEIILPITQGEALIPIIGTTPLMFNRMGFKTMTSLLLPSGRMTGADKAARLKHNPVWEYRQSVYRNSGNLPETRLKFPSEGFHGAMKTAALDMPKAKKTEVGRLVSMTNEHVNIYGIPKLHMGGVRMADMAHTPDVRTRAIVERWCCFVPLTFVRPKLNIKSVLNLMAAGGIIAGIGDWRQEKGSGNKGKFRICDPADEDFKDILATGGRSAQDAALDQYECWDEETEQLLEWYSAEIIRLGREEEMNANLDVDPVPEAA